MLRAAVLDFDGVIIDSESLHFRAFNEVLAQYKVEISLSDYYKDYLGLIDLECFWLVSQKHQLRVDEKAIENLMQQKNQIYEDLARTEAKIIDGVAGFLDMLAQNKLLTAICSGSLRREIELILDNSGMRHYFDTIVSAEDMDKGKPDPHGFLVALQRLNEKSDNPIQADQCIAVEDSHWGLEAAQKAGMHTIAVTNSYDADQLSMADKIVQSLSELSISDLQSLCD